MIRYWRRRIAKQVGIRNSSDDAKELTGRYASERVRCMNTVQRRLAADSPSVRIGPSSSMSPGRDRLVLLLLTAAVAVVRGTASIRSPGDNCSPSNDGYSVTDWVDIKLSRQAPPLSDINLWLNIQVREYGLIRSYSCGIVQFVDSPQTKSLDICHSAIIYHHQQESRAVARKLREAAAVLFGLKFANDI